MDTAVAWDAEDDRGLVIVRTDRPSETTIRLTRAHLTLAAIEATCATVMRITGAPVHTAEDADLRAYWIAIGGDPGALHSVIVLFACRGLILVSAGVASHVLSSITSAQTVAAAIQFAGNWLAATHVIHACLCLTLDGATYILG